MPYQIFALENYVNLHDTVAQAQPALAKWPYLTWIIAGGDSWICFHSVNNNPARSRPDCSRIQSSVIALKAHPVNS